jgi:peptide/nickel transport system substrate-binding protein
MSTRDFATTRRAVLAAGVATAGLALSNGLVLAQEGFKEAPALAAKVAKKELPPVAERLPKVPMVVKPHDQVGRYGGLWRATMLGASDHWWLIKTIAYEGLVRLDLETNTIVPNLAESYEVTPDGTEFTFVLREGLKWSDGQPFTAEDIQFWYDNVATNAQLTPGLASWLRTASGPVVVKTVDQRTVKFVFKEPNGLFLRKIASNSNIGDNAPIEGFPKHHLAKLHAGLNPNADAEAKAAGFSGWVERFTTISGPLSRWRFTGLPTMLPWMLSQPYDDKRRVVSERNPFYFKVDTAGHQLPYLDGYDFRVVDDAEAMVLRASAGEIDLQDRTIASLRNKSVLFDNQKKGNYSFFEVPSPHHNTMVIYFNHNHANAQKRALFQTKDFRIALSHAINRKQIIDLVYYGQGEPWQVSPRKESVAYDEKAAKQYTDYDKAKANALLDGLKLDKRDSAGYRLGPDGARLSIIVEAPSDFRPDWIDVLETVKANWKDVGVDLQIRPLGRSLIRNRALANEHEAFVFLGNGGMDLDLILEPDNFLPYDPTGYRTYALLWSNWFQSRSPSEEPPAPVKTAFELYRKVQSSPDAKVQGEAIKEIVRISGEQFYNIGISLPPSGYGIISNAMRNVPKSIVDIGTTPYIGLVNPEQFYKAR